MNNIIFSQQSHSNLCLTSFPKTVKNHLNNIYIHHPKQVIITNIALGSLAFLTYSLSKKITFKFSTHLVVVLSGATVLSSALLFCQWFHIIQQIWHAISHFYYTPNPSQVYKPITLKDGSLRYYGNLPVVQINENIKDPKKRGQVLAKLMPDTIYDSVTKFLIPMLFLASFDKRDYSKSHLRQLRNHLHIPKQTLEEIDGICDQIYTNTSLWMDKDRFKKYLRDAVVFSDIYKAIGCSLACTTISYKGTIDEANDIKGVIIGRNLDWASMGFLGERLFLLSYFVKDNRGNDRNVLSFTFPAYTGTLTARNSDGFCICINELGKTSLPLLKKRGTPYNQIAKELVENIASVEEALKYIDKIQASDRPVASSVTMTLSDKKEIKVIRFYPDGNAHPTNYIVESPKENEPFVVCNHYRNAKGDLIEESICERSSLSREKKALEAIATSKLINDDPLPMVQEALSSAGVIHTILNTVISQSNDKRWNDKAYTSFHNFFAHDATTTEHDLP